MTSFNDFLYETGLAAENGELFDPKDKKMAEYARSAWQASKIDSAAEIKRLRDALLMYHQAWNGSSVEWKQAMRRSSDNAETALSGKCGEK